jgi:DNA-nicking Smr family endonuclease
MFVKSKRTLSQEERDLWEKVTQDDTLLFTTEKKDETQIRDKRRSNSIAISNNKFCVDQNILKKIVSGKINIDSKIDLHGYIEESAYNELKNFIRANYKNQKRCLLIIVGKGTHTKDESSFNNSFSSKNQENKGRLNKIVPQWLCSSPFNQYISFLVPAASKHGGDGAIYVYLKK